MFELRALSFQFQGRLPFVLLEFSLHFASAFQACCYAFVPDAVVLLVKLAVDVLRCVAEKMSVAVVAFVKSELFALALSAEVGVAGE